MNVKLYNQKINKYKCVKHLISFLLLTPLIILSKCECGTLNNSFYPIDIIPLTGYGNFDVNPTLPNTHIYYLDSSNISGTEDGLTVATAFTTLNQVKSVMVSGDTIRVRTGTGTYGIFTETTPSNRTDWITFIVDDASQHPVFSKINVVYNSLANCYLRFDGIEISVPGTNSTFDNGVNLENVQNFELRNCDIHNDDTNNKYYTDYAVRTLNCSNVLIYQNHMRSVQTGNVILGTQNITICKNHIHHLGCGDGVRWALKSRNGIIERNNIYDSIYNSGETGDPGTEPHSCAIEIRSNHVWINKNIMHGIGNTAGIRMYPIDASGGESAYGNIIIENNLIYDTHNTTLIIENLGTHIIVRNNNIIGRLRTTGPSYGATQLNVAISVVNLARGYDGSGLSLYNNIIVGLAFSLPPAAIIRNNIIWSLSYSGAPFIYIQTLASNTICTWDTPYPISYFTSGFFTGISADTDFAVDLSPDIPDVIPSDYNLVNPSTSGINAINFGDPANQPTDSLGTINANNFVNDDGTTRGSSNHSAGCYEP